jgi:hypothetical protein
MLRTTLAIAFAGLIFMAVSGTAQATPITPLPANALTDVNILTDVAWRRCWRDRWGRLHCAVAGVTAGVACVVGDSALEGAELWRRPSSGNDGGLGTRGVCVDPASQKCAVAMGHAVLRP